MGFCFSSQQNSMFANDRARAFPPFSHSEKCRMKSFRKIILSAFLAVIGPAVGYAESPSPIIVNGIDAMPQGGLDGRGIMNDAVMEALKRAGLTGKMQFLPWKRAQQDTIKGKDIIITGLSRTEERESKYTWLFSVFNNERTFVTVGAQYKSFEEAKASAKHIVVTNGSAQYDILLKEGFSPSQLGSVQIERQKNILTMLLSRHTDAWFCAISEAKYYLKDEAEASKFVIGPPVGSSTEQYVACSKDCDPDLVARMKKAGEEMKADGTIAAILQRYQ